MKIEDTIYCDGCGVEILWTPVRANSRHYCCADCRDGYQCACGARMESEDDARDRGLGETTRTIEEGLV